MAPCGTPVLAIGDGTVTKSLPRSQLAPPSGWLHDDNSSSAFLPPGEFAFQKTHSPLGAARPPRADGILPEGAPDKSREHAKSNVYAGMPKVVHVIGAINVCDITVVVVVPAYGPSFIVPEPVAAVVEAAIPADHPGAPHVEPVVMTEMGTVANVRNAAIVVAVIAVAEDAEGNVHAGMPKVVHVIGSSDVLNITVVVVVPAYGPSFIVPERVAAVLEAVIPADHLRTPHAEGVSPAEMGTVIGVRNAAILAAAVASNGLCLLPSGRPCLALRPLRWLWLRSLGAL